MDKFFVYKEQNDCQGKCKGKFHMEQPKPGQTLMSHIRNSVPRLKNREPAPYVSPVVCCDKDTAEARNITGYRQSEKSQDETYIDILHAKDIRRFQCPPEPEGWENSSYDRPFVRDFGMQIEMKKAEKRKEKRNSPEELARKKLLEEEVERVERYLGGQRKVRYEDESDDDTATEDEDIQKVQEQTENLNEEVEDIEGESNTEEESDGDSDHTLTDDRVSDTEFEKIKIEEDIDSPFLKVERDTSMSSENEGNTNMTSDEGNSSMTSCKDEEKNDEMSNEKELPTIRKNSCIIRQLNKNLPTEDEGDTIMSFEKEEKMNMTSLKDERNPNMISLEDEGDTGMSFENEGNTNMTSLEDEGNSSMTSCKDGEKNDEMSNEKELPTIRKNSCIIRQLNKNLPTEVLVSEDVGEITKDETHITSNEDEISKDVLNDKAMRRKIWGIGDVNINIRSKTLMEALVLEPEQFLGMRKERDDYLRYVITQEEVLGLRPKPLCGNKEKDDWYKRMDIGYEEFMKSENSQDELHEIPMNIQNVENKENYDTNLDRDVKVENAGEEIKRENEESSDEEESNDGNETKVTEFESQEIIFVSRGRKYKQISSTAVQLV